MSTSSTHDAHMREIATFRDGARQASRRAQQMQTATIEQRVENEARSARNGALRKRVEAAALAAGATLGPPLEPRIIYVAGIVLRRGSIAQLAVRLHEAVGRAIDQHLDELELSPRDYGPIIRVIRATPSSELDPLAERLEHLFGQRERFAA